jgi:diamine N-acetyltransferase
LVLASRWTLAPSKPVPRVTIQRATLADVDAVAEVAEATFALACPPETTEANIRLFIDQNLSPQVFGEYLQSPHHRIWLATTPEGVVGYALAIHEDPAPHTIGDAVLSSPTIELSKIYVVEGEHGSGVAADLLQVVVEDSAATGAKSVWLGVNNLNVRANRFYEKHGFVLRGTRQFQVGDKFEDDYVRERMLQPEAP